MFGFQLNQDPVLLVLGFIVICITIFVVGFVLGYEQRERHARETTDALTKGRNEAVRQLDEIFRL